MITAEFPPPLTLLQTLPASHPAAATNSPEVSARPVVCLLPFKKGIPHIEIYHGAQREHVPINLLRKQTRLIVEEKLIYNNLINDCIIKF